MRESRECLDRERKWHNRVYCKGARIAVVLRMPFSFTARAIAPGLDARDAATCRIELESRMDRTGEPFANAQMMSRWPPIWAADAWSNCR